MVDLRERDPMEYAKAIWSASLENGHISIGGGNVLIPTSPLYAVYVNRGTNPVQFLLFTSCTEAEQAALAETDRVFERNRNKLLQCLLLHEDGEYVTVRATDEVLSHLSSKKKYLCASVTDRVFTEESVASIQKRRRDMESRTRKRGRDMESKEDIACRYLILQLSYTVASTVLNYEEEWIWEGYGSKLGGDWKLTRKELDVFVQVMHAAREATEEALKQYERRTGKKRLPERKQEEGEEPSADRAYQSQLELALKTIEESETTKRLKREFEERYTEAQKLPLFMNYLASEREVYRVRPIVLQP